jgi:hypothetical protein
MSSYITKGNGKLDKGARTLHNGKLARNRKLKIFNSTLPAFDSCPGQSKQCTTPVSVFRKSDGRYMGDRPWCYAGRGAFDLNRWRHEEIMDSVIDDMSIIVQAIEDLPYAAILRLHQAGDLFSVEYIEKLRLAILLRPDLKVFGFTRSWRIAELLPALEKLRALPNVNLFASTDATMLASDIRKIRRRGWRIAKQNHDSRKAVVGSGIVCPEQTGKQLDCKSCLYCSHSKFGDVGFSDH